MPVSRSASLNASKADLASKYVPLSIPWTTCLDTANIPYHPQAYEMAEMGFIPAGAYRNRNYAGPGIKKGPKITRAMEDICYDPQTSGGLLMALPAEAWEECLAALRESIPQAAVIGRVTRRSEYAVYLN